MSPFTQLSSAISPFNHPSTIDRNFTPLLSYLDEFDRHFSNHHRFINCYIPRFDLEEDASNYYLYGEVPGAHVEDINIEAQDERTLVVSGNTRRPGPLGEQRYGQQQNEQRNRNYEGKNGNENTNINDNASNASHPAPGTVYTPPANNTAYPTNDYSDTNPAPTRPANPTNVDASSAGTPNPNSNTSPYYPPPPTQASTQTENQQDYQNWQRQQNAAQQSQRKILLSERLVGEFHRTFTFPTPVNEAETQASVENGVLYLVVPKREEGVKRGRKIPVVSGLFHKGN